MTLRVVGAGLGRTGTLSLKLALERLLGAPCHHMVEVFAHPEQVPLWHAAARGEMPDWRALFDGYAAVVDWPGAAFWPEIAAAFPEATILLSVRDAEAWWKSASATIFPAIRTAPVPAWRAMVLDMLRARFTDALDDHDTCISAFERHYADARRRISPARLLEWRASEGWAPICRALGVPVPDEPFPRTNSTAEFVGRLHTAAAEPDSGGDENPRRR